MNLEVSLFSTTPTRRGGVDVAPAFIYETNFPVVLMIVLVILGTILLFKNQINKPLL
jgi:hypothetical protein